MRELIEEYGINPDTTPVDVFMQPRFEQQQRNIAWDMEHDDDENVPYPQ